MKEEIENKLILAEEEGINIHNEKSLHLAIKNWYKKDGDRFEAKVDGSIIDIVRGDLLIEVQTANFSAIKPKLERHLTQHKIMLVHPVIKNKIITCLSKDGEVISQRKSPKKGTIYDLFDELIRIPELINNNNLSIEVLFVDVREIRCADGKGSWRRKGVSKVDKKLEGVLESILFNGKEDFLELLPQEFNTTDFSNKNLSKALNISIVKARKITYCLKKMGAIKECGKKGNELLFAINRGCLD